MKWPMLFYVGSYCLHFLNDNFTYEQLVQAESISENRNLDCCDSVSWSPKQPVGPLSLKDPIISLPNPASFSRRKVLLKMTFDYHNEVKKKMIITFKGKRQHQKQIIFFFAKY
jgi:hypothetical protein